MNRLQGKTALVTAAGQGIGRAIAEAFLREGATVWATDLDVSKLEGLEGAEKRRLDVLSSQSVEELVAEAGSFDILVNAAGFVHHGTILECSDKDWDFSFNLNVTSMHRTIKAVLPGMLEKGRGSIVNIASGASSVRGIPNRYVYGTTKAAVIGLTKAVAADFIKRGVRANAICPGTVRTPIWQPRVDRVPDIFERLGAWYPIGRVGEPEDIANAALYLATDEAAFVTGAVFPVDGGLTAGLYRMARELQAEG